MDKMSDDKSTEVMMHALRVVDVDEGANLGRAEGNVLLAQHNLELLRGVHKEDVM